MPATQVIFYAEDGASPFLAWLDRLQQRAQDKIFDAVARLEQLGHELRRPEAEYLGDDIYELRIKKGHVNYRPLYFFDDLKETSRGRVLRRSVIVHGCTKEGKVDPRDIKLAVARRARFRADRAAHTYVPAPDADE
jgi:hypothetical protein